MVAEASFKKNTLLRIRSYCGTGSATPMRGKSLTCRLAVP